MKTFFLIFTSFTVLFFSGCSTTATQPIAKNNPYKGKKVSTYLVGSYESEASVKEKLQSAGFDIVATYTPVKKGKTVIFTNAALKHQAMKPGRAHIAALRVFIDDKEKMISITNPIYFGKAFMQNEFEYDVFAKILASLHQVFPNLKGSKDALEFEKLSDFHFMMGMPYYQDADLLAQGDNDMLLKKLKNYKKGKNIVFTLKLSKTSTLVGYELSRRTKKFVKKVGRANAAILPWTIAIENGKATALNAKYYIAISYPLLTMNDFMGIATVPGAIEKELSKPFKK